MQFVDVFLLYRCSPLCSLRYLLICTLAVVSDSCTLACLSSNIRDVSIRKIIHVDRHYFVWDIRLGLCLELLATVRCGLFPASCDSEEANDLQHWRIVVPVLTRKLENARALSLLHKCRSSPPLLGCFYRRKLSLVLRVGIEAVGN